MAGYDTAGQIQDTYVSARDEFGVGPLFWIRYFSPSPAADIFSDNAVAECEGAWASGGHYVGPVSAPYQSNLSGSTAQGQADAQTYCASMLSAYYAVVPLVLPSNKQLYCWLDQEYSTSLSLDYLDGWAGYIANYNFAGLGTYPLYPCLYCDPGSPYPNCSTMAAARGLNVPAAVWSNEPEPCGGLKITPAWGAERCATVPTKLWQYGEQGACGYSANVDLDVGAPGFNTASYCFNVRSDP
jgi:hypothetical protein